MGILKEFKDFAIKGNMIDMAVGIVIGGAFGKIISSLVSDVIMPPLGALIGGVDFSNLVLTVQSAVIDMSSGDIISPAITLNYGTFIQTIVDFLLVAGSIFFVIRLLNKAKHKEVAVEEVVETPPAPSAEETLLTEIRDLLKNK